MLGTEPQVSSILGTCYILHHRATSQPNGAQHWLQRPQAKKASVSHCLPEAHGPRCQRSWRCCRCQQIILVRIVHSVSSKKFMGKSLLAIRLMNPSCQAVLWRKGWMCTLYFYLTQTNKQKLHAAFKNGTRKPGVVIVPALGRWRQGYQKFSVSLCLIVSLVPGLETVLINLLIWK